MQELPDCLYEGNQPALITPSSPTPNHSLYLSNLDDHHFLRFSIKYLYLFQKSPSSQTLKDSLSRVLVDYYPLAGRIKVSDVSAKLEVDCNGEGAVFAEAFMDITCQEFLEHSPKPNKSWRKLLFKVQATGFLDIPPLIIQVPFPSFIFVFQLFFFSCFKLDFDIKIMHNLKRFHTYYLILCK